MGATYAGRLGDRLENARHQAFVGRTRELRLFRDALDGVPGAASVLFLHGPGGVGKSTLLHHFHRLARPAGRDVVHVDGSTTPGSVDGFTRAVGPVADSHGALLLIDTFEQCQPLEGWLREECLPHLPAGTVTVVAGRQAPDPGWL